MATQEEEEEEVAAQEGDANTEAESGEVAASEANLDEDELAQEKKESIYNIQANININNNGISWIPIYTLGKPSIISDIKFSINNFSVNPRFRFDVEDLVRKPNNQVGC